MSASYLTESSYSRKVVAPRSMRKLVPSFLLAFVSVLLVLGSFTTTHRASADNGFDPNRWVMCYFGSDTVPGKAYKWATTDELPFLLRSKSSITMGREDVTGGLNQILDLSGKDRFRSVNEEVLGRELVEVPKEKGDDTVKSKDEVKYNGGVRRNPYDRFGVAGLTWTSYQGEWKYVVVESCADNPSPNDPGTGKYYPDRMVPQTTWDDIPNTRDARTEQMQKGVIAHMTLAFMSTLSNFVFLIAKFIVVLTIAFINFAFTDIAKIVGIDVLMAGKTKDAGVFGGLFNSVFMPLITFVFLVTGVNMAWSGIVKRQFRQSMNVLLRSVALFLIAFIVAAKPLTFINVPNNVAVTVQAVMAESMNTSLAGGSGLCKTDSGKKVKKLLDGSEKDESKTLEYAAKNMKSSMSCALWYQFLFKPWAQGQFGTDWNKTWVYKKTPDWAEKGSGEFKTDTANAMKVAGDAEVPLGDGTVVNNWALFQLSTQTNVHAPIDAKGKPGKTTAGMSNDWWRIVDVLSGYDEKEFTVKTGGGEEKYVGVDPDAHPLDSWNTWVGDSVFGRLGVALTALLMALVGTLAPLLFASLAAVYSLGLSILMALSPLMLLLGCWSDRGWQIFKGWGELVINTTIKRIVVGVLTILSFIFTSTAIRIMENGSWIEGVVLAMAFSYLLVKSRKKIMDAVASIRFSAMNFARPAERTVGLGTGAIKGVGAFGSTAVVGGVSSARKGGSFSAGMKSGARSQLRNLGYRNSLARQIIASYDQTDVSRHGIESDEYAFMKFCAECGKDLTGSSIVGRLPEGRYICEDCLDKNSRDDVVEMNVDFTKSREQLQELAAQRQGGAQRVRMDLEALPTNSNVLSPEVQERLKEIVDSKISSEANQESIAQVIALIEKDIREHRLNPAQSFTIPSQIEGSLDVEILNTAWEEKDYDYIREAHLVAWLDWYQSKVDVPDDEREDLVEEVRERVNELSVQHKT